MSKSPKDTRPKAACIEEYDDENQCPVPGTRTSSQMRQPRRSKRSEPCDSGYASTAGSRGILKDVFSKVRGTKKSSKETMAPPAVDPEKTVRARAAMPDLRINTSTKPESREAAARIQLSGEPVRKIASNKSQEYPPQLSQSANMDPPPVAIPIRIPAARTGPRPSSYHAGGAEPLSAFPSIQCTPPTIQVRGQIPIPPPLPIISYSYQQPSVTYVPAPMPQPVIHPTIPHVLHPHPPSAWVPPSHVSAPPLLRRNSMAGYPIARPRVEYPMVPRQPIIYHHPIEPLHTPGYREQQVPYHQVIEAKPLLLEDNEAYYRYQEQLRHEMPPPSLPPQRPLLQTIATTPVMPSNRNSVDYIITPTSSRGSFSSVIGQPRGAQMVRTISSGGGQVRGLDTLVSTGSVRRSRPTSLYYTAHDLEEAVERYQDEAGPVKLQPLTIDAIEKVNKSSRSRKSRASEAGSRNSDIRKVREGKKAGSETVSLQVKPGCTATITKHKDSLVIHAQPYEENKERSGRQVEREGLSHRPRASSRRESVTEVPKSILPRSSSSTRLSTRRERPEQIRTIDVEKRLTDRTRDCDETAVEDDGYSETEVPKKKAEKLTARGLARMKSPTDSPPSSRARSVRSAKSTTSSRRGIPAERHRS